MKRRALIGYRLAPRVSSALADVEAQHRVASH
jgi:hypothetical protein